MEFTVEKGLLERGDEERCPCENEGKITLAVQDVTEPIFHVYTCSTCSTPKFITSGILTSGMWVRKNGQDAVSPVSLRGSYVAEMSELFASCVGFETYTRALKDLSDCASVVDRTRVPDTDARNFGK